MGVDIHLYICKDEKYIAEDIFDGRNSEWFQNMQKCGNDEVYDSLPLEHGISNQAPAEWNEYANKFGYYGFYYIKVGEFCDWFIAHRPDEDAGWVTRYEAWAYRYKEIEPEYLKKKLDKDLKEYHNSAKIIVSNHGLMIKSFLTSTLICLTLIIITTYIHTYKHTR